MRVPQSSLLSIAGVILFLAVAPILPYSVIANEEKPVAAKAKDVVVQIKISDKPSGLAVDLKKTVPSGSNAFDVLRGVVTVDHTTHPMYGPFVVGLCGVDAPTGVYWSLSVDGSASMVGIGAITLDKDTLIEWKTEKIEVKK